MPRVLFCLYSRHDKAAEQKLQAWQCAYSRAGWDTTVLSHAHGPGFVHELRLGRPRSLPAVAWLLHGREKIMEELGKEPDLRVFWCGFPLPILSLLRRRMVPPRARDPFYVAFGRKGRSEAKPPSIVPPPSTKAGNGGVFSPAPILEEGTVYDLRCGGEKNPYHWLMYSLAPLARCRRHARFQVLLNPDPNAMQIGSLGMLGLAQGQILTHPPARGTKGLPGETLSPAEAVQTLRNELGSKIADPPSSVDWLHVSRRDAVYRRLLDEDAIGSVLPEIRPLTVVMSELAWEEQIAFFRGARVVSGVHGAAFVFILFGVPGATLVEFFPGGYERNHFRALAGLCGLHWEKICCVPVGRQGRRCREADLRLGPQGLRQLGEILRKRAA